jgi:hypothetical protein
LPQPSRSRNPRPPKDERTKFDKWFDRAIEAKQRLWFLMFDGDEILCLPVLVDRYMLQVNIDPGGDPDLVWLNKGAILKASHAE